MTARTARERNNRFMWVQAKKLKILFIQLPYYERVFKNSEKFIQNLPMAAAMLKAFAMKKGLLGEVDFEILNKFDSTFSSDARLLRLIGRKAPDFLCFSLYSWSAERSLYIAGEAKKILPGCKVIVGGPEVTVDSSSSIFDRGAVDIGVEGEGELVFSELLSHFAGGGAIEKVRGIIFKKDGRLAANPPGEPLQDLNDLPSPYLTGIIDPRDFFTMWLETMRWCPQRCSFCAVHSKFRGKKAFFSIDRIREEIRLAGKRNIESIGIIDSCINMSPNFEKLCEAIKEEDPERRIAFGGQIFAGGVTEKTAELLSSCNFRFLEVGLQSTDPAVLANVRRRENLEKFLRGVRLLIATRAEVTMDIIIGLPGQTTETLKKSVFFLVGNRLSSHSNYNMLSVFPSSDLYKEKEKWGIKTQKTAPYRILETAMLSFEDIKRGRNFCQSLLGRGEALDFSYPLMVTHAAGVFPYLGEKLPGSGKINESSLASRPVTRILFDLTAGDKAASQWRAWLPQVSESLAHTTLLWFKTSDPAGDLGTMSRCLADLSAGNPMGVWNVILETDKPVTGGHLDRLRASISYRVNVLDYDHYFLSSNIDEDYFRISDQFFVLHPYSAGLAEKAPLFHDHTRKTLWSVQVCSVEGIADVSRAVTDDRVLSLVVDFSMSADGNLIYNTLSTCKSRNVRAKPVWMTNWAIQYVWESMNIDASRKVTIAGADEHILLFGKHEEPHQIIFERDALFGEAKKLFFLMKHK